MFCFEQSAFQVMHWLRLRNASHAMVTTSLLLEADDDDVRRLGVVGVLDPARDFGALRLDLVVQAVLDAHVLRVEHALAQEDEQVRQLPLGHRLQGRNEHRTRTKQYFPVFQNLV